MKTNIGTYLIASVTCLSAGMLAAAEYYAKDGISDWTVGTSFTLDAEGTQELPSGTRPGASDTVFVKAGNTVTVDSEASLDVVNALTRIRPMDPTATVVVSVPDGVTWTNSCPVNYDGAKRGTYDHYGRLVKRGAGSLELYCPGSFITEGYDVDYNTSLICEAGTLSLSQSSNSKTSGKVFCSYIYAVSNNAAICVSAKLWPYPRMIAGAGDIIYTGSSSIAMTLTGSDVGGVAHETEFSGRILGKIEVTAAARVMFTGTASSFSGSFSTVNNGGKGLGWNGITGVRTFGKTSDTTSSIGTYGTVAVGSGSSNAGYLCLATAADGAQTTDKTFWFRAKPSPCYMDAGAYGNVTFSGNWTRPALSATASSTFWNGQIVLAGSNTVCACSIAGGLVERDNGGTNYCFHLTKKGTGIWRLKDNKNESVVNRYRDGLSAVSVEEGIFQFDSLKRKYDFCAFGTGAQTMSAYTGLMDDAKKVAWQVALGANGSRGTLEYTGTDHINGYSRPIVFKGDAGLRNNTPSARVRLRALPPEGDSAKTLTLDGSNALDNEIADVTDTASAPVSVVKEGTGKWILGGDSTFHGDLTVKAGELVVRKYPTKYTWFKWVIKNNVTNSYSSSGNTVLQADHFCLYDANTIRQNQGLSIVTNKFADLQPGEACYETERKYYDSNGSRSLKLLFNDSSGSYGMYLDGPKDNLGNNQLPKIDKPETWWPIVMRLTNGAPEVVGWDYTLYFGPSGSSGYRGVGISTVEGSVDGIHWDNLLGGDKKLVNLASGSYCWASAGSANKYCSWGCAIRHTYTSSKTAYPLPDDWKFARTAADGFSVLSHVGTVSVAGGAKLTADGDGIALSSLKLDASAASDAQISGFSFAENGTLEIVNMKHGAVSVPLAVTGDGQTFPNVASWSVTGLKRGYRVRIGNGRMTLVPPASVIFIR